MANLIPSFASGSNLAISIDGTMLAYATNLSFTDDMTHAPVGGIGSFSYDANEPTQYAVRGSFTITQYNLAAIPTAKVTDQNGKTLITPGSTPARVNPAAGNSMLRSKYFSPLTLLLQNTFDIVVYERAGTAGNTVAAPGSPNAPAVIGPLTEAFHIYDCRLTSYSFTFTPGQLVGETLTFTALKLSDVIASGQ